MAVPARPAAQSKYSEQYIQNTSFDEDYGVSAVENLAFTGSSMERVPAPTLALKLTTSGTNTYVATAKAGTAQSSAAWQVMKIDSSSGVVITWADGNTNFDNVATDLTSLSYS